MTIALTPSAAMRIALATYLKAKIIAVTGLAQSEVLGHWPEPLEDLKLSRSRVVLSVIQAGAAKSGSRLGVPVLSRITPGAGTSATFRYNYDEVAQPLSIGVWAATERMRDEVDSLVSDWLNRSFWSTIAPLVSTTAPDAIAKGVRDVAPASMADIWPGTKLLVDANASAEYVDVASVTATTFRATFTKAHAAGVALVEVPGYRATAANGLNLRLTEHRNVIAFFDFDEPQNLDSGANVQRQEWRSLRNGTGRAPYVSDVTATARQSTTVGGTADDYDVEADV